MVRAIVPLCMRVRYEYDALTNRHAIVLNSAAHRALNARTLKIRKVMHQRSCTAIARADNARVCGLACWKRFVRAQLAHASWRAIKGAGAPGDRDFETSAAARAQACLALRARRAAISSGRAVHENGGHAWLRSPHAPHTLEPAGAPLGLTRGRWIHSLEDAGAVRSLASSQVARVRPAEKRVVCTGHKVQTSRSF